MALMWAERQHGGAKTSTAVTQADLAGGACTKLRADRSLAEEGGGKGSVPVASGFEDWTPPGHEEQLQDSIPEGAEGAQERSSMEQNVFFLWVLQAYQQGSPWVAGLDGQHPTDLCSQAYCMPMGEKGT